MLDEECLNNLIIAIYDINNNFCPANIFHLYSDKIICNLIPKIQHECPKCHHLININKHYDPIMCDLCNSAITIYATSINNTDIRIEVDSYTLFGKTGHTDKIFINKKEFIFGILSNIEDIDKMHMIEMTKNNSKYKEVFEYFKEFIKSDSLYYISRIPEFIFMIKEIIYSENKFSYKLDPIKPKILQHKFVDKIMEYEDKLVIQYGASNYLIDSNCINTINLKEENNGKEIY